MEREQIIKVAPERTEMLISVRAEGDELLTTVRESTYGSNIPSGGVAGQLLMKRSNADYDMEWVSPANAAERDNTLPITSAAVYMEVGNINALLATI